MEFSIQKSGIYKASEQAHTLTARDFKDATDLIIGGGGGDAMSEPIMMSDRKGHNGIAEDGTATTLTAQGEERPVAAIDFRNGVESESVNGTLQAKSGGGYNLNSQNTVRCMSTVRRLTPLECTRLQGYPDGWLDIGEEIEKTVNDYEEYWEETKDSHYPTEQETLEDDDIYDENGQLDLSRYGYIKKKRKIGAHTEKVMVWYGENGKKHKGADSTKYKALGNSIALPFWEWLDKRISAQYVGTCTLGSLFDGIGGFPLCHARNNGPQSVRWASEIEEFPMAVTRRHFGDETTGEEGDIEKYLWG